MYNNNHRIIKDHQEKEIVVSLNDHKYNPILYKLFIQTI